MNEVLTTSDGSHTLKSDKFDATYHSIHGAIDESNVVFINAGLKQIVEKKPKNISIIEVGFGTGLNALLTLEFARDLDVIINYHTLEPFPLLFEDYSKLNYPEILNLEHKTFLKLHESEFYHNVEITDNFYLTKYKNSLQEFSTEWQFDLVYFDAFAPSCQPELWTLEIFKKLYNLMNQNSILTTYCAKGEVKRNLKSAGFKLESLPGPGRKREITRVLK